MAKGILIASMNMANAAEDEFHGAVRDVERSKAATRHARGGNKEGVYEEVNLGDAHAKKAGENDLSKVFDAGMGEINAEIEAHAAADELRNKDEELKGASD